MVKQTSPKLISTEIAELLPMHRAPGNHVSEIVSRLAVKSGVLETWGRDENTQLMFELGSAWEDHMAKALSARFARHEPHRFTHGLELELDGITGNLDLFDATDDSVHEVKLSAMSLKWAADPQGPKFWRYWRQAQSYCSMLGVDTAVLHVCFYRGDYKEILVAYRAWSWTWTAQELAMNWRMMVGNKVKEN